MTTIYLVALNTLTTDQWRTKEWQEIISDEHPAYFDHAVAQKVADDLNAPMIQEAYDEYCAKVQYWNNYRKEQMRLYQLAKSTGIEELMKLVKAPAKGGYEKLKSIDEFYRTEYNEDGEERDFYDVVEREVV